MKAETPETGTGNGKVTPAVKPGPENEGSPTSFLPYGNVSKGAAFFHIALQRFRPKLEPISRKAHAIRWNLSRPLDLQVLPRCIPATFSSDVYFITYGQILLFLPLLALLATGSYLAFVSHEVDGSGKIAGIALLLVFLSASKTNSIFSFFLGISFERLILFHNMASLAAVALSIFHGYVPYVEDDEHDDHESRRMLDGDSRYRLNGSDPDVLKFMFDGDENFSGSLLTIAMVLLVLTSFFPILRRKFFDLWFWIHIFLAFSAVIFAIVHGVGFVAFLSAGWWLLDILMRYMVMAYNRYPREARLEVVTSDVVKISFLKPDNFSYNAGQFVQIAFPDLSVFAFHPVSISSAPHEKYVTLHVRGLGNWSKRLVALAKSKETASILVEGPYGCASIDIEDHDRYQMVLCVSGGIGVTHSQSVAKSILNEHGGGRKLKQLRFVWAIREPDMLKVMDPLETPTDLADPTVATDESGIDPKKLVKADIFLTKTSSNSPSSLEDGRKVHHGRPDLNAIIKDMKDDAMKLGVTHVAVFACGPMKLLHQVKATCRAHSKTLTESEGVYFHVHEEVYYF